MITHKGTQEIFTQRLGLRKYKISDINDIYKNYATDEMVARFLSWVPYKNIEDLEKFVAGQISGYTDHVYNWVIEFEQQVIGSISVIQTDEKNQSCEIGYCIGVDFWNKGIMSEAVLAVLHYLFYKVGYHRIYAKHDVENPASGKVMQKCNMIYEGKLRKHYLRHDHTFSDALIYGILTEEFSPQTLIKNS